MSQPCEEHLTDPNAGRSSPTHPPGLIRQGYLKAVSRRADVGLGRCDGLSKYSLIHSRRDLDQWNGGGDRAHLAVIAKRLGWLARLMAWPPHTHSIASGSRAVGPRGRHFVA